MVWYVIHIISWFVTTQLPLKRTYMGVPKENRRVLDLN